MTIYVVYSGGNGTSGTATTLNPSGTEWSNAYATIGAALAVATASDQLVIAHDHVELPASALGVTFPATPGMVAYCVDRSTGALAATAQIGVGAANGALNINGCVEIFGGIHWRSGTNNSSSCVVNIGVAAAGPHSFIQYGGQVEIRTINTSCGLFLGQPAASTNDDNYIRLDGVTIDNEVTAQSIRIGGARVRLNNITLAGAAVTTLFVGQTGVAGDLECGNSDLSAVAWGSLYGAGSATAGPHRLHCYGCKFPSGWAPGAFSAVGLGGPIGTWVDCAEGDTHGLAGLLSSAGSVISDTGVYLTAGLASQSWKFTTTAACGPTNPLQSPWISRYFAASQTIAPRLEVLRNNDSTSAYTNAELWAECDAKVTSGFPTTTRSNDRVVALASAANQGAGAGTGSWTGGSGSQWSGELEVASLTTQEAGHVRMRAVFAVPSVSGKLHVQPEILV